METIGIKVGQVEQTCHIKMLSEEAEQFVVFFVFPYRNRLVVVILSYDLNLYMVHYMNICHCGKSRCSMNTDIKAKFHMCLPMSRISR